jgi:putative heme-binding domain-containing protein
VRVAAQTEPDGVDRFAQAVADSHPRVRLEGVRGLAGSKSPAAAEIATRVLDLPMDRTLDYALWLTLRELEPHWMPEFKAGKLTFGGDPKKLAFALNAVGTADAVKPVLALIEGGTVPAANRHGLWLLLARVGGPDEVAKVVERAGAGNVPVAERIELVRAAEEAARLRRVGRPAQTGFLKAVLNDSDPAVAATAARLTGQWKDSDYRDDVERLASAATTAPAVRAAAAEGVALYGDPLAKTTLGNLATTGANADVKRAAVVALASLDLPAAAGKAAAFLPTAEAKDDLLELYGAFLNRKGGAPVLAKALATAKLPPDVAKLGLRAVRSAVGTDGAALADALTKAGDLAAARKEPTPDDIRARVADLAGIGDPARGEAVFRRRELQCLTCHAIGGAGGRVGPDLTSIGASAQPDYLVESLLLPNKAVKEGYHAERVVTADDKVYVGVAVREANGMLVLRDEKDKEVTIPTRDIAERGKTRSLMPESLTDPLTRQEFADLARFLTELGKVGPYAASPARLVRRWEVIEGTPENMNLARRTRLAAAAEAGTPFAWSPLYSKASGTLPVAELPRLVVWQGNDPLAVARFQLDVTTAGKAALKFNGVTGLSLFVDGRAVDPAAETVLDLPAGVRTVTVVIDRAKRTDDLRVELADVPGSPARAAVVGGK